MRPARNVFQKLSRTEQRREGVVAYMWSKQLIFIFLKQKFTGSAVSQNILEKASVKKYRVL